MSDLSPETLLARFATLDLRALAAADPAASLDLLCPPGTRTVPHLLEHDNEVLTQAAQQNVTLGPPFPWCYLLSPDPLAAAADGSRSSSDGLCWVVFDEEVDGLDDRALRTIWQGTSWWLKAGHLGAALTHPDTHTAPTPLTFARTAFHRWWHNQRQEHGIDGLPADPSRDMSVLHPYGKQHDLALLAGHDLLSPDAQAVLADECDERVGHPGAYRRSVVMARLMVCPETRYGFDRHETYGRPDLDPTLIARDLPFDIVRLAFLAEIPTEEVLASAPYSDEVLEGWRTLAALRSAEPTWSPR